MWGEPFKTIPNVASNLSITVVTLMVYQPIWVSQIGVHQKNSW